MTAFAPPQRLFPQSLHRSEMLPSTRTFSNTTAPLPPLSNQKEGILTHGGSPISWMIRATGIDSHIGAASGNSPTETWCSCNTTTEEGLWKARAFHAQEKSRQRSPLPSSAEISAVLPQPRAFSKHLSRQGDRIESRKAIPKTSGS